MYRKFRILLVLTMVGILLLTVLGSPAAVTKPTGREIIQKVDNAPIPEDMVAITTMTLINDQGQKKVRQLKTWKQGKTKTAMVFLSPKDVKGTAFLTIDRGQEDDMWLYLPSLDITKRIDTETQHQSFMGSDFTYDDLGDRDIDDYTYELLREETYQDHHVYVVKGSAKNPQDVGYSKVISWVRDDIWKPVKVEYYDLNGELKKVQTNSSIEKIEGFWTIQQMKMKNIQRNHQTIMHMSEVKVNQDLSDGLFDPNQLPNLGTQ